ncbi:hypothetical protein IU422_25025 [Nocardia farcinica]|nr:hypothetical protein [Nocardia farcinica]
MTPVFALVQAPTSSLVALIAIAVLVAIVALLPLRSGNGQHAHAGPGAVMVWQLVDAIAAEARKPESPPHQPPEPIAWPPEEEEYAGRHRLLSA